MADERRRTMSDVPVWMTGAIKRLAELERAIEMHRFLIEEGKLSRDAIDDALWRIYDGPGPQGCNGSCCG